MGYILAMIEISQTEVFAQWFDSLRDAVTAKRIVARIRRLKETRGNSAD
jgi:putative component of toxin-antitoxin plasmid stabilization module